MENGAVPSANRADLWQVGDFGPHKIHPAYAEDKGK